MIRIDKCVETLKLAYLSRTPIAWVVVNDKEVAQQIATTFTHQHFGGNSPIGNVSPLKDISALLKDTISKKSPTPSVYFGWTDEFYSTTHREDERAISSLLSTYLDFFLSIEFEGQVSGLAISCSTQEHVWDRNFVIITSPSPPSLGWINSYIETIYLEPIHDNEIKDIITQFAKDNQLSLDKTYIDQLVVNFRGVSERQIESVLLKCLSEEFFDSSIEKEEEREQILSQIRQIKRQMLEGFSGLKWITIRDSEPQAAGLNAITKWLEEHQPIFSDPEKSVNEGFDIPKGLLITGIPGTGKSLMAKQTSRILKLPLVAMDLGDIQEGIVGKSEEHMAAALRMVDAMAPCVLWIDEIEKAFSGAESGQSDGGVMRRMFGKFLTWMQEKTSYCFVLATSNDISKLPPELFRSQRFDEKYYTFMPSAKECAQMFVANIKLQNKRIKNSRGLRIPIFDGGVFEKEEFWLNILNNVCTSNINSRGIITDEPVQLDKNGSWLAGYLPQKKLFTGADIASFISVLKFRVLTERNRLESANYGFTGPIKKVEVDSYIISVLADFTPYGQSNLKDIAKCFRSLAKNRFRSASATNEEDTIVRFSDYDELNEKINYDSKRFLDSNSRYDRTLYMCIVGAINSLSKYNQQTTSQKRLSSANDMASDKVRSSYNYSRHED